MREQLHRIFRAITGYSSKDMEAIWKVGHDIGYKEGHERGYKEGMLLGHKQGAISSVDIINAVSSAINGQGGNQPFIFPNDKGAMN